MRALKHDQSLKGKLMIEERKNTTFEIRVSEGKTGSDPDSPDWEVAELENGRVVDNSDIYDNLTYAEAQQIAGMWTKKKEEAEASGALD